MEAPHWTRESLNMQIMKVPFWLSLSYYANWHCKYLQVH